VEAQAAPTTGSGATVAGSDVDVDPRQGLSTADVAERVAAGRTNVVPQGPSRTVAQILRANTFTYFNALLGSMFVVVLILEPKDALFGGVLVANALIGIVQELRAKRTLDRLAILSAPRARMVRDGATTEFDVSAIVQDDVLEVSAGDQVVVDGVVLTSHGLELDESLVTGESDAVDKQLGDEVLSGSFVAAGSGRYRATRVGTEAFAASLAEEAKKFSLARSELRAGVNTILRLVTFALVPASVLLVWGQYRADQSHHDAIIGAIAGLVAMVPEGLVLLTSMAFVVGVIRLGRRQCLVQELAAVETLARVSVICLDKTGTITDGRIEVDAVEAIDPTSGAVSALDHLPDPVVAIATTDPDPNATMAAIKRHAEETSQAGPGWALDGVVPFSSARKWSACVFDGQGAVVVGAPEVLLASLDGLAPTAARVEELSRAGRRVVLVATSASLRPPARDETVALPGDLTPCALVVLEEQVRGDAPETLDYFALQGLEVKVISGDNPLTVGAVAARVGVRGAESPVDARTLGDDEEKIAAALREHTVFGRVTPHQKRAMVHCLQRDGHVVAMTGDGVNDVLALKDADMGIAMGTGSAASRAVAQVVLLDSSFATFPHVVAEGRRVIANIERVANLFVTKTIWAVVLAFVIGVAGTEYPFLPRHLTFYNGVAIGIPGFFMALLPALRRAQPRFAQRVLRFTVPTGAVVAAAVLGTFFWVRSDDELDLQEVRTATLAVLVVVSLYVLGIVARPFTRMRALVVAGMIVLAIGGFALGPAQDYFEMELPPDGTILGASVVAAAAAVVLELMWRLGVNRPEHLGVADEE
jgi:cation-transporting P-type ATPase E